jgi:hypothetical protein
MMECWTMPQRKDYLKNLDPHDAFSHQTVRFQGSVRDLPVYMVPVVLPCYRLANGRTRAVQAEYRIQHGLPKDFFSDPDSTAALDAQDELLGRMLEEKNLIGVLRTEEQTDALVLDNRGYVINGNRRLCAMCRLLVEDPVAYGRFHNVRVVILPTCTEEDIRELEAQLQIKPDTKAEYSWIDLALMQRQLRNDGKSDQELAKLYGIRTSTVQQSIDMLSLAEDYLSSRGWDEEYSKISGSNQYAFEQLLEGRRRLASESMRNAFTKLVYLLIDDPKGGRLYGRISLLATNLGNVVGQLKAEMEVPLHTSEVDVLFGGVEDALSSDCAGVVELLDDPTSHDKVREIVKNEVERIDQLGREDKGARFCLKRVVEAHTALEDALSALDKHSVTKGLLAHLDNIESLADQLRQKIDELH